MNFSDPNIIIDELRMEISRFSVGNSNNLSLFLGNARKALNQRSSDGKTFLISDKSDRRKLQYNFKRADDVLCQVDASSTDCWVPMLDELKK